MFRDPKRLRIDLALALGAATVAALVVGALAMLEPSSPGQNELDEAWAEVQLSPRDPQRWARLADAQTTMDELMAAEHSYRTALRLGAGPGVAGRLGYLLYARGEDRAALPLLEEALAGGAELPLLSTTVATLKRTLGEKTKKKRATPPKPAESGPPHGEPRPTGKVPRVAVSAEGGACTLAAQRSGPHGVFRIQASIDGRDAQLIVDTGASLTAIADTYLEQRGIRIDETNQVNAITATGPTRFPTAHLESIEIAGRRIEDLTVAVCTECGGRDAVGLLGLDVQAALGLEMDLRAGLVRLLDCEP